MEDKSFFNDVMADIRAAVKRGDARNGVFRAAMNIPKIQAYIADYFSREKIPYVEGQGVPRKGDLPYQQLNGPYSDFKIPDAITKDGVRPNNAYPLSYEEKEVALRIIEETPVLGMAIGGFKMAVCGYFEELKALVYKEHGVKGDAAMFGQELPEIALSMREMHDNAAGFSFFHDLLPIVASQIEQSGAQPTGTDFHLGLNKAFRVSAFKSYLSDVPVICPFGRAIGHLAATVLEEGTDGRLMVSERKEPGWLLAYIGERVSGEISAIEQSRNAPQSERAPAL